MTTAHRTAAGSTSERRHHASTSSSDRNPPACRSGRRDSGRRYRSGCSRQHPDPAGLVAPDQDQQHWHYHRRPELRQGPQRLWQTYITGNGTVTNPVAACQELYAVNGDVARLNVHPTWLTSHLMAPIATTATGHWGATSINFSESFSNGSVLEKYTGDVFTF